MSKIIVTFEVPADLREFIRLRAKMQEQSMSGYLRNLVKNDKEVWDNITLEQWSRWIHGTDDIGVSNGN